MDYQGNSNKEKDAKNNPPKKELEKVVSGEVVMKPKALGGRFKSIFFGGDISTAIQYVGAEVLLPALRNLVVETISKGADRLIYGDSGRRPRSNYGPRVQYNNPINRSGFQRNLPDRRSMDRWSRDQKTPEDVIVASREDADMVVERLTDIVDSYDVVSMADLYELLGLPSSHIDNKWGWTNLSSIEVRQVREGYRISFPPLEEVS